MKNVGFIGCGNMASAMISGIVKSNLYEKTNIIASNTSLEKLEIVKEEYGIKTTSSNKEVAKFADVLFLAVKPNKYETVIKEIKTYVKENVIIISIAPGITMDSIKNTFDRDIKVVRTMPNTPCLIGEGMVAITLDDKMTEEEKNQILSIFKSFGEYVLIDENYMDIVPGISGSSPAYVYMFIEALADGAVKEGLGRDIAYKMAAQAVKGAAGMVLETGKHPGKLKDEVCSPGGTTIEAVYSLEKNNLRYAVMEAVEVCTKKTRNLSK
ncbi:MAG: pyrroline-5-carboxylate reductase [Clostridiaceae bacterium]